MTVLDAGEIALGVAWHDGRIVDVELVSQRPHVAAALIGRPADAAVALVPSLFALCGKAQGRAATLALAAARGVDTPPHVDAAVAAEAMREHLWRLLLDLPPTLDMPARRDLAERALPAAARGERAGVARVLDDPFWPTLFAALAALPELPCVDALLPNLDADATVAQWPRLDAALARWPTWQGEPAETGAHARYAGRNPAHAGPLAARWQARCAEVWAWAGGRESLDFTSGVRDAAQGSDPLREAGGVSAAAVATGVGRALVATARGLLMHEITLEGETIADYVIVAPTEWNFHPAGALADWLIDAPIASAGAARALAEHAVAALDPCVATRITVTAVPPPL